MSDWQPIETAPRDGTSVLLHMPYPSGAGAVIGSFHEIVTIDNGQETRRSSRWCMAVDIFPRPNDEPTHWMPIPPLPAAS